MADRADLRSEMGKGGREHAGRFTADRTAEGTYLVYGAALKTRRRLTV